MSPFGLRHFITYVLGVTHSVQTCILEHSDPAWYYGLYAHMGTSTVVSTTSKRTNKLKCADLYEFSAPHQPSDKVFVILYAETRHP